MRVPKKTCGLMSLRKDALKNFAKFTGKYPCRGLYLSSGLQFCFKRDPDTCAYLRILQNF